MELLQYITQFVVALQLNVYLQNILNYVQQNGLYIGILSLFVESEDTGFLNYLKMVLFYYCCY